VRDNVAMSSFMLLLLATLLRGDASERRQRFAVISTATPDYIEANEEAIGSRRCYCLRHDYAFVLETTSATVDGRDPHWNKLPVLRKYLPYYDWVFFVDVDIFVTNSSVQLAHFTAPAERARPGTRFIFNDGIGVNSGAFFVRGWRGGRDAWTAAFLERWWHLGGEMRRANREYESFLRDQGEWM